MENKKKTESQKKTVIGSKKQSTDVKNKVDSSKNPEQKKRL
ncbi:hypothetical protein [Snuella lapsa]|uniref:Uncharacterized protein n=1 Tax=Snuella lapsa TaxID=870481 RepID=A0ABP6X5G5_9FLAO